MCFLFCLFVGQSKGEKWVEEVESAEADGKIEGIESLVFGTYRTKSLEGLVKHLPQRSKVKRRLTYACIRQIKEIIFNVVICAAVFNGR